jgi:hypothetical protein
MSLANSLLKLGRGAEAVTLFRQACDLIEKRNGIDAESLYNAACFRALTSAALRGADKSADGAKQPSAEADRAMVWLKQAVAAGWNNPAHMEADHDLDVLRERADFKELLGNLKSGKQD